MWLHRGNAHHDHGAVETAEIGGMRRTAAILAAAALPAAAFAGALDRIHQDNVIRIAYRADAPPFSYKNSNGEPAGFIVDLCQALVRRLAQQLNLPSLNISYLTATAVDRFAAIQENKADLLCEPTSSTLSRRKIVDFSVATFVDGASLMITAEDHAICKNWPDGRSVYWPVRRPSRSCALHSAVPGSPAPSCQPRPTPRVLRCWMAARHRLTLRIDQSCWR